MPTCRSCESKCTRYEDVLSCSMCGSCFHIGCVGINETVFGEIRREVTPWRCSECADVPPTGVLSSTDSRLEAILSSIKRVEDGFSAELREIRSEISLLHNKLCDQTEQNAALRNEISQLREVNQSLRQLLPPDGSAPSFPAAAVSSYSQAASRGAAVVVKPKSQQSNAQTKSDLLRSVNSTSSGVEVTGVKHISGGGVVIRCSTSAGANTFKKIVENKLSEDYEAREAAKLSPRIRLVGMNEQHDPNILIQFVKTQNPNIFDSSPVECISFTPLNKNSKMFQAVLQVDARTYGKTLSANHVFVGYDSCTVYDALEVTRCFNCCGFHHLSKNCKKRPVCPRCAGEHVVKDCKSESLKCVNCSGVTKILPDVDTCHAAWDHNCSVYKKKLESLKLDIIGPL